MELELILGMMTFLPFKTPDTKPEELSEGELLNIHEKSGCDKKNEDVSEEVTLAKKTCTLKEFMGIFHNIEKTKHNRILEADPNTRRSMTICQGVDGMQVSYCKLFNKEKKDKNCSNYSL